PRLELAAYAGQPLTHVPITTAYAVLEQALRELHPGMLEDGTAIGTAIGTAANRLRRAPGKSKVLVLLTDGVNNKGTVDPRTAGEAAATFGIKIYTIGIGTRGQAPMPTEYGADGQLRYEMRARPRGHASRRRSAPLPSGARRAPRRRGTRRPRAPWARGVPRRPPAAPSRATTAPRVGCGRAAPRPRRTT